MADIKTAPAHTVSLVPRRSLRSFGELIDATVKLFRERFTRIAPLSAIIAVFAIASSLSSSMLHPPTIDKAGSIDFSPLAAQIPQITASGALAVLSYIASTAGTIAIILVLARRHEDEAPLQVLQLGLRKILSYFWIEILAFLAVLVALLVSIIPAAVLGVVSFQYKTAIGAFLAALVGLLVFIVLGVVLGVWFTFAKYELVVKNQRGIKALRGSREIVRGHFWGVLWRSLIFALGFGLLSLIVAFTFTGLGAVGFKSVGTLLEELFVAFFFLPVTIIFSFCLYSDISDLANDDADDKTKVAVV